MTVIDSDELPPTPSIPNSDELPSLPSIMIEPNSDELPSTPSIIILPYYDELPSTPEEEGRIIEDLEKKAEFNRREGDTYYLLSASWHENWKKYTSSASSERPGPIDNTDLVSSDQADNTDNFSPQLIETVRERHDYVKLSEESWGRLYEWYKGGPPIARKMIITGYWNDDLMVEIFPLRLKFILSPFLVQLSRKASLYELYEEVCKLKELKLENVQIYEYDFYHHEGKRLLVPTKYETLGHSKLLDGQTIIVEVQDSMDGSDDDELVSNVSRDSTHSRQDDKKRELTTGLQNLGNTCFMNSALQCLAHTPQILDYFLEDYSDEINRENPLGMKGELADVFGGLLRMLWSSGKPSIPPNKFKHELDRFAPQFRGNNQHDSQELLAFLLDGLHEDLNRVKQKPYIETKDSDGRPDEEVADEFWTNHKSRNDSVIVDVCQGQYKSTLVCPDCSKLSVTFDPFMYLSVPLPAKATRDITVTVFHGDGTGLPTPFTVTVFKNGTCKDLLQALADACGLSTDDEYLVLAEVYCYKIHRYLEDSSELLRKIQNSDYIVAYRLPKPKTGTKFTRLEIAHRRLQKSFGFYSRDQRCVFLTPLVTVLEDPKSSSDVYQAVARVLTPFLQKQASEESKKTEDQFQLSLPHDYRMTDIPVVINTPMEFGDSFKVALDWNEREYEVYNAEADCLKDVPRAQQTYAFNEEAISLFSCLDAFLQEEPLGPDDMWYCPDCKEHRQATKKLDLWKLPDVLVFHLKRFSYNGWMRKNCAMVSFPVHDLDLSSYVRGDQGDGDHTYELYAVSNHYGGMGGGHYTAYCKSNDKWYNFNDAMVSQVDEDDIKTSAAYVLFYRRVGTKSDGMVVDSSSQNGDES